MLKVKRVRGRRFLSIGDDAVEIDYAALGPVVHIRGLNRDAGAGGSNGSGKSALLEMIMYGLTGKLLKGLNHKEVVNANYRGGMELDIEFHLPGVGECLIERRRDSPTKGSTVFTANGKKYDLGLAETQAEIQKHTGLTYEALANVAFFGQHNKYAFLSCESEIKRRIVETMLGLEKYGKRHKLAKDRRKDLEKEISKNARSYEDWHGIAEVSTRRMEQARIQAKAWREKHERDMSAIKRQIEDAERTLAESDAGRRQAEYDAAQADLAAVQAKLNGLEATRAKLEDIAAANEESAHQALKKVQAAYVAHQEAARVVADIERRIKEAKDSIEQARGIGEGVVCRNCRQVVSAEGQEHFCRDQQALIESLEAELEARAIEERNAFTNLEYEEEGQIGINKKASLIKEKRTQLAAAIRQGQAAQARLSAIRAPDANGELIVAKERIASLRGKLESLEAEADIGNPHETAVFEAEREASEAQAQADDYKELVQGQEAMLPYYDYWIHGFGDDGIRSMVIDDILPPLNRRVEYWMQILMDGRLSLTFKTSKLSEVLERRPSDGNQFVHAALSGGEHQRIDLGLSQSFAHIMGMSVGNIPSIIALDEVAAHVDREGVRAVYRMITELAKDRQVLVITHDPDLQDLLAEADQIVVEKKQGVTRLVSGG